MITILLDDPMASKQQPGTPSIAQQQQEQQQMEIDKQLEEVKSSGEDEEDQLSELGMESVEVAIKEVAKHDARELRRMEANEDEEESDDSSDTDEESAKTEAQKLQKQLSVEEAAGKDSQKQQIKDENVENARKLAGQVDIQSLMNSLKGNANIMNILKKVS